MISILGAVTGIIGAWVFSDGLYSIMLYLDKPGYTGAKQTWKRDHWIRAVRSILGIFLIIIGLIIVVQG